MLTPQQDKLYRAIRFALDRSGIARGLVHVAEQLAGQDYKRAWHRLARLEQLGLVQVHRPGPGRAIEMTLPLQETTTMTQPQPQQETTTMTQPLYIALDPGFGNTKVAAQGRVSCQQSAVARPVEIGLAANGMTVSKDDIKRVHFDNYDFVAGLGAWRWGNSIGSMDYAGLVGPERLALMYAGIADVCAPGDLGDVCMIIGLPVPLMQDTAQMEPVVAGLKKLKREHVFAVNNLNYRLNIIAAKVVPQPLGAYMEWLYNDDLQQREGANRAEVAVIDLGMNTLDLYVIERGQVRPGFLGGGKVGVRRLLSLLSNNGYELAELDAMLRDGRLKAREGEMDIWLGEVLAVVERTWPSLRRFTTVIPTGGGAALLDSKLTAALAAKGAAVYWPTDPVTANARGLWKFGKHNEKK